MLHAADATAECPTGPYGPGAAAAVDGDVVVVYSVPGLAPPGQRYLFVDGRRGSTVADDGVVRCTADGLIVRDAEGTSTLWPRIALRETDTAFTSLGSRLAGRLIEPESADPEMPLVVMVHGSERTSATRSSYAYMMAAQGIRVFAYDKRGTGESEGEYTQNFELLADDAAAALGHAREMTRGRVGRAGYFGGSQGGWVAPLAATRSDADFVAIGFGLVVSPIDEDREQMISEARAAGFDARAIEQIERLSQATARLLTSHFNDGFEELEALRHELADAPWAATIQGEHSGAMLRTSDADLRRVGRARFDNLELIWDYDAQAVLERLDAPLLWVLAEQDREAPIEKTRGALQSLTAAGKPVDVYLFPDTDHGMFEFRTLPDGQRQGTRITDGYLRLLGDWIKDDVDGTYGRGTRLFGDGN
nr:alpha/beta hydrolase [Lysobacter chinensis]